jgi:predicted DNA-binding protein with PD1-like motif
VILAESRRGRRIIGRLDRGVELLEAITSVCHKLKVRCGEVRAIGSLEAVEVAEYDQREKQWRPARRFQSAFEILNLSGNVSERAGELVVHAHVAVMRDRDNGIEVVGGHLVRARVFALEFVIDAFDDLVLRRGADDATGLQLWNEKYEEGPAPGVAAAHPEALSFAASSAAPSPAPSFEPKVPNAATLPSATWADVARASQRVVENEEEGGEFDVEQIRTGDVLDHPRFGRCTVERLEGEQEFAAVRLETGRLVRLALDVLRFRLLRDEDGRRVLQVRVQR